MIILSIRDLLMLKYNSVQSHIYHACNIIIQRLVRRNDFKYIFTLFAIAIVKLIKLITFKNIKNCV